MNVAVAGLGFMGVTHLSAWRHVRSANLVAVMSSDPRKLSGDFSGVRGNLDTTGDAPDISSTRKFGAFEELLATNEVDTVDLCLPSNLHASAAIAALEAGKNVFLEKPMALTSLDCDAILEAADASGRKLMVGHVLRFMQPYKRLKERLPERRKIRSAVFRRECGTPPWLDLTTTGGEVIDLLIHDLDFCIKLWGAPHRVTADELHYAGMPPVRIEGGWHADPDYPFSMSYRVETEDGVFAWKMGEGDAGGDPFQAELEAFAQYVHEGGPHPNPPDESALAVRVAEEMTWARSSKSD